MKWITLVGLLMIGQPAVAGSWDMVNPLTPVLKPWSPVARANPWWCTYHDCAGEADGNGYLPPAKPTLKEQRDLWCAWHPHECGRPIWRDEQDSEPLTP